MIECRNVDLDFGNVRMRGMITCDGFGVGLDWGLLISVALNGVRTRMRGCELKKSIERWILIICFYRKRVG